MLTLALFRYVPVPLKNFVAYLSQAQVQSTVKGDNFSQIQIRLYHSPMAQPDTDKAIAQSMAQPDTVKAIAQSYGTARHRQGSDTVPPKIVPPHYSDSILLN